MEEKSPPGLNIDHYVCYIATGYRLSAGYFICLFVIRLLKISHFFGFFFIRFFAFVCISISVSVWVWIYVQFDVWGLWYRPMPAHFWISIKHTNINKLDFSEWLAILIMQFLTVSTEDCTAPWHCVGASDGRLHPWNFNGLYILMHLDVEVCVKKWYEIDHSRFLPFIRSFPFWFSFFLINLHGRPD